MNDDDLITVLRAQRDKIPMRVPADEVIGRGRALRARRRFPAVAGLVAAAAAVAVGVTIPAGHHLPGHGPVRLAAWTVTRQANGSVKVTIRELLDPSGLQRTLRADGVPASVTFAGRANPSCRGYPFNGDQAQRRHLLRRMSSPGHGPNVMIIHPHGLPPGGGVQITAAFRHLGTRHLIGVSLRLVKATPACTG